MHVSVCMLSCTNAPVLEQIELFWCTVLYRYLWPPDNECEDLYFPLTYLAQAKICFALLELC